jgi:hypothetical protein
MARKFTAFVDDSMDEGVSGRPDSRTCWSVAVVVPSGEVARIERALSEHVASVFPEFSEDAPEIHFTEFIGSNSAIPNTQAQCEELMSGWRELLMVEDARIVVRGVYSREVTRWIDATGGGRSQYDVVFGHTLQHLSRVIDGDIAVIHDNRGDRRTLDATFERARKTGVYSRRLRPCPNLASLDFWNSESSRLLQASDMYAWCFQRVWAQASGRMRGSHQAPMSDQRSEMARKMIVLSKPAIAHRRVWRPRVHGIRR